MVSDLVYSEDGRRLTSVTGKGVRRWDTATLSFLDTHDTDPQGVHGWSAELSPDGRIAAFSHADGRVTVMDTVTGRKSMFEGNGNVHFCFAFSLDATILAAGDFGGFVKLWRVPTHETLFAIKGHDDFVCCVAVSPDGKTLATGSKDQTAKLWDTRGPTLKRTLELAELCQRGTVWSLEFSPDGTTLASACANSPFSPSRDHDVRIWDVADGRPKAILKDATHGVLSATFSPDGKALATVGEGGTITVWDATNWPNIMKTIPVGEDYMHTVLFTPDGSTLISAGAYANIKFSEPNTGRLRFSLPTGADSLRSTVISPDGTTIATGSLDGSIRLYRAATRAEVQAVK
jgi:WD40 repeat protein